MKSIKSTKSINSDLIGVKSIKSQRSIAKNILAKNDYLKRLLGQPTSISQKFHGETKINAMSRADGIIDSTIWPKEWIKIYYKSYGRFEEIKLPPAKPGKITLEDALTFRESRRDFSRIPVSMAKLSNMLYYSAGLKTGSYKRFYPSPGGRYPLEIFVLSLNTVLTQGFYHYYVRNNSLEKMFTFKKRDFDKITTIPWVKKAGFVIFISAVFTRNSIKYGDRGYRHILVEAGHMAQNFYLNAEANNLGICAIGGYIDDGINSLLELDGLEESVIYTLVVGEKELKSIKSIRSTKSTKSRHSRRHTT